MRVFASSYLFPLSTSWSESGRARVDKENGDLAGHQVSWLLRGFVTGTGATGAGSMSSALQTLINAADGDDKSFYVRDGSTTSATIVTRGELSTSNTEGGTKARVTIDGDPSQQYATGVDFKVEVEGFVPASTSAGGTAGLISHEYKTTYSVQTDERVFKTTRGEVRAVDSSSSLSIASALLPAIPSGYVRWEREFNVDEDDKLCTYSVQDRQYHKAPPSFSPTAQADKQSVYDGFAIRHTITATVQGDKGKSISTVRDKALDLADDLVDAGAVRTRRRIQENEFTNTVTVTYELTEARAGGITAYRETVSYDIDYGWAHNPKRDGSGGSWSKTKALPTAVTVRQSGSMTATSPPTVPDPILVTGTVNKKNVTPESPTLSDDGVAVLWSKSWAYEIFLGATEPSSFTHPTLDV